MSASKKKKLCAALVMEELNEIEEETAIVERLLDLRKYVSKVYSNRRSEGVFKILIQKHLLDDEVKFKAYFRFTREQFYDLLNLIEDDLKVDSCNRVKKPITPAEKLALTLRFLATGESFTSLAFSYRISAYYISTIIPIVLKSVKEKLQPLYLCNPEEIDWQQKAEEFWKRWDFPNVVGALDGKHVRIVAPINSGSLYYNYKKYFSIVLLALVDANCKFLVVDVGSYGKEGDAGIFNKSVMGKMINDGTVIFHPPQYLPNSNVLLPYVVLGDEAFRLDKHMMKAYCKKQALEEADKRNFNYHLSKVRRVSENAFGIMCSRFRIFFTPIFVKPETVDLIVMVCCCLHNLLRNEYRYLSKNSNWGEVEESIHELPVENMIPLAGTGGFAKSEGFKIRSRFTEYFKGKSAKKKNR